MDNKTGRQRGDDLDGRVTRGSAGAAYRHSLICAGGRTSAVGDKKG